jgi:hypothetical protein
MRGLLRAVFQSRVTAREYPRLFAILLVLLTALAIALVRVPA